MKEAEFQKMVQEIAQIRGWKWMHVIPTQIRQGVWATATRGDQGFPDLVLARPIYGDLIFAELKMEGGKVSEEQKSWINTLMKTGVEAYIWYPSDIREIISRLSKRYDQ